MSAKVFPCPTIPRPGSAEPTGDIVLGQLVRRIREDRDGVALLDDIAGAAEICRVDRHVADQLVGQRLSQVAGMSKGNSPERARMMFALGAEVVLVDQLADSVPGEVTGGDLALVEEAARRVTAERPVRETGSVNQLECRSENELWAAEIGNWRVSKITLRANSTN